MLCVIEYFAKSLKVIPNDTREWGVCKSLIVFHCNCVSISYRLWDIQHRIMAWPWNLGYGSFKVVENGTMQKFGYRFLLAFHSKYGCIFSRFSRQNTRTWQTKHAASQPPHVGIGLTTRLCIASRGKNWSDPWHMT